MALAPGQMRLAYEARGKITFDLTGLDADAIDVLTSIEHAARHGRLTPRRVKALQQALDALSFSPLLDQLTGQRRNSG